jgi:hypothetical protein
MMLPIQGPLGLALGVVFGVMFGVLLQKGRVAEYNVIVNQFRLKDFTVLRVILTAIFVGGIGVLALHHMGYASYHIKEANMLGVSLGGALFGVGMVVYGYCPGTGVAAMGSGSLHAAVGFLGMLVGGILYALTYGWVKARILSVASLGKIRFPDITNIPDLIWFMILAVIVVGVFTLIPRLEKR